MIEKIKTWVSGFPGFGEVAVDALGPGEGVGLFPQGEQTVGRKADILGTQRLRRRFTVLLRLHRRRDPQSGDDDTQQLLERFARWAAGGWPLLGEDQTVRTENGRLQTMAKEGLAKYELKLIFEYTIKE